MSIRIEEGTLTFFDPGTRELLRTRPSPLTWDQVRRPPCRATPAALHRAGDRPAGGQQHRSDHGRRAEDRPGRIHARQIVTVYVAEATIAIDLGGDDTRTVRRTTTQPVRSIKAQQPRKAAHVS